MIFTHSGSPEDEFMLLWRSSDLLEAPLTLNHFKILYMLKGSRLLGKKQLLVLLSILLSGRTWTVTAGPKSVNLPDFLHDVLGMQNLLTFCIFQLIDKCWCLLLNPLCKKHFHLVMIHSLQQIDCKLNLFCVISDGWQSDLQLNQKHFLGCINMHHFNFHPSKPDGQER